MASFIFECRKSEEIASFVYRPASSLTAGTFDHAIGTFDHFAKGPR